MDSRSLDPTTPENPKRVAILDASSAARRRGGKRGAVEDLALVLAQVREEYDEVWAIADASLRHHVDDQPAFDDLVRRGEVLEAPSGVPADRIAVRHAERSGAVIVTNDALREYHGSHPFLLEAGRVIGFLLVGRLVYLEPRRLRSNGAQVVAPGNEPAPPQPIPRTTAGPAHLVRAP